MSAGISHILAIDVGNTRIKCGLLDMSAGAEADRLPRCRQFIVVPIDRELPWPLLSGWTDEGLLGGIPAVLAGSHPDRIRQLIDTWPADGPAVKRAIDHVADLPIAVRVTEPEKIGIDRVLNAVAANAIRAEGVPAIIVDSGTATTVDVVAADGAFAGGAILPGFELAARSLHDYTAKLPLIDVVELEAPPPLGDNTNAAIRSGLFWGQVGAVRELVSRLSGESAKPLILLTGGAGHLLQPFFDGAAYEAHLSLQGLALSARFAS